MKRSEFWRHRFDRQNSRCPNYRCPNQSILPPAILHRTPSFHLLPIPIPDVLVWALSIVESSFSLNAKPPPNRCCRRRSSLTPRICLFASSVVVSFER